MRAIAAGLVVLTATGGCSRASDSWLWREIRDRTVGWPVEDTVPGPTLSDAAVTSAVKARLAADPGSDFTRVTVDTEQGRVVLMGVVTTWGERLRAEQLALGTTGSIGVVNQLRVEPPPKP
jgi:hyperosmotically inducible protein